jgi:hypothetical protein
MLPRPSRSRLCRPGPAARWLYKCEDRVRVLAFTPEFSEILWTSETIRMMASFSTTNRTGFSIFLLAHQSSISTPTPRGGLVLERARRRCGNASCGKSRDLSDRSTWNCFDTRSGAGDKFSNRTGKLREVACSLERLVEQTVYTGAK